MTIFQQPFSLTAGATSSAFAVVNGLIRAPDGANFIARGMNIYDDQPNVITNAAAQPLTTLFPGINFIRLVSHTMNVPSFYQTLISRVTPLGIVVEIEHHIGAGGGVAPLTGQALIDESNWFASLAAAYKSNPYVWFGSLNEPGPPGNDVTSQQVATYNAIRGTGNNTLILLQTLGDYPDGLHLTIGSGHGLQPNSAYAVMTNVVWDTHFYNGLPHFNATDGSGSYSTDQNFLNTLCKNYVTQAQTIHSADGVMPVIIGEYGISTDDVNLDPGGTQTCIAAQQSGVGSAAWNWQSGGTWDKLTDGSGNLTTYGQQVASYINATVPTRNWWENPGQNGSFWVQPFQTTAQWIASGSTVTALRNGNNSGPTGYVHVNVANDFVVPYWVGGASDPLVRITANNGKSIQVRIPVGAGTELPITGVDNCMFGADKTQPYLLWTANAATINTTTIQASGSAVTCQNLAIDDGSGQIMTDIVTGQPGTGNGFGTIQDYELTLANANPNYVIPHMLAYLLDPSQCNSASPIWPLKVVDTSLPNTGGVTQGYTIGIPNTTPRPTGKTRGFYLLWDSLQQFGWFFYNVASNGCLSIGCYHTSSANAALTNDIAASISAVMGSVCLLSNQTGLASLKGFVAGGGNAYPAPPKLDLTPTGGHTVSPSSFGAWYPSGYNVTSTNT